MPWMSVVCLALVPGSQAPAASVPARAASVAEGRVPWVQAVQELRLEMDRAGSGVLYPRETEGYTFSLSPDESWLALVSSEDGFDARLCVFHLPGGRFWSAPVSEGSAFDFSRSWYPNCFAADAKRIHFGTRSAPLAPAMGALELAEDGSLDLARLQGTCLGLDLPLRDARGTAVAGWDEQGDVEGKYAWSVGGTVGYRAELPGQHRQQLLRVTPPGELRGVRFSRLLALVNELLVEKLDSELEGVPHGFERELLEEMRAIVRLDERTVYVTLSRLSVSPDGQLLVARATIYRGGIGHAGQSYAVLIPLALGGLEAFPLAREPQGKLVWGRDSRSLYVWGWPLEHASESNGLLRLELDLAALPAHIEPVVLEPYPDESGR